LSQFEAAMIFRFLYAPFIFAVLLLLSHCAPTPTSNVLGYLVAEQLGSLATPTGERPRGALSGRVLAADEPIAGAAVLVAERTGQPYVAYTDNRGHYRIEGIPMGQYTPAAVAPGYQEMALTGIGGIPYLMTIDEGETTVAPPIVLSRHAPAPLPAPWPAAAHLSLTASAVMTAAFPAGATAQMYAFHFVRNGVRVDTLRLYLPLDLAPEVHLPLMFMVYPTYVDLWSSVSTAYANQGFALVAISPMAVNGTDIAAHAADARLALALAQDGLLSPHIGGGKTVALGGSFSSAILHQLIRDSGDAIAGWVTVGGISNAFAGAAAFYAGQLEIPPQYEYLIPALGPPNLYPLEFLRYSPVYTAAALPPTLIIHTDADRVIPLEQALELEQALQRAGVPVELFTYHDVSHYLQIDEKMTDVGREMFFRTVEFAKRILDEDEG
jgi:fermentation-respiration switch protein FrsA (DUF1100 family)